jgi:predicted RNA-binding Zn-ribbon protein involved in translation (DUF1610 family)
MAQYASSESPIDRRYRELFLSVLPAFKGNTSESAWSFPCPYCSELETKEWKRNKKTACLIWNPVQNSWKFACQRCGKRTNFFHALHHVSPLLGEQYQRERDQAGTTGWGHDCPSPPLQGNLPTTPPTMPERPLERQEDLQAQPLSSAPIRLPRLTPQEQAGQQSRLNHRVKQRQRQRQERQGC